MPLDEQVAKDSFTAFLEAWKAGEQQAALKNKTPSIVGRRSRLGRRGKARLP
jgi:hypothetical protein